MHIALLVFAANFTFVGLTFADSQSTAQQTASYTKPYVLSPILNQPQSSTLGLSGSTGGGQIVVRLHLGVSQVMAEQVVLARVF